MLLKGDARLLRWSADVDLILMQTTTSTTTIIFLVVLATGERDYECDD